MTGYRFPLRKADGTWADVTISAAMVKDDLPRLLWLIACLPFDADFTGETPVTVLREALAKLGGRTDEGEGRGGG